MLNQIQHDAMMKWMLNQIQNNVMMKRNKFQHDGLHLFEFHPTHASI